VLRGFAPAKAELAAQASSPFLSCRHRLARRTTDTTVSARAAGDSSPTPDNSVEATNARKPRSAARGGPTHRFFLNRSFPGGRSLKPQQRLQELSLPNLRNGCQGKGANTMPKRPSHLGNPGLSDRRSVGQHQDPIPADPPGRDR
jgi:hypothetical protein